MALERYIILKQNCEIDDQAGKRALEWRNSYNDVPKDRQAPRRNARVLVENLFDLQKLVTAARHKRHKKKSHSNDKRKGKTNKGESSTDRRSSSADSR
jgi:hypothetical protein